MCVLVCVCLCVVCVWRGCLSLLSLLCGCLPTWHRARTRLNKCWLDLRIWPAGLSCVCCLSVGPQDQTVTKNQGYRSLEKESALTLSIQLRGTGMDSLTVTRAGWGCHPGWLGGSLSLPCWPSAQNLAHKGPARGCCGTWAVASLCWLWRSRRQPRGLCPQQWRRA